MTDPFPPTRSQVKGSFEFLASFAGAAYNDAGDGGMVELEIPDHLRIDHGQTIVRIPEQVIQDYIERWIRANGNYVIGEMIDSDCALEDESPIEDKPCPRTYAHGEHYWDESLFGGRTEATPENPIPEYHCTGIKAHPRCMIAGGRNADA